MTMHASGRKFAFLGASLVLSLAAALPAWQTAPDERDALMKEKLEFAQKVFAGLSRGDLGEAGLAAGRIGELTRDARWRISETPEYQSRSVEFERTATTLAGAAAGKNAEGAALAFVQLTTQCFDCHRWWRESRKPR